MHVGGKLIDSNYCHKKFLTQEEFAEETNYINGMFVKKNHERTHTQTKPFPMV